MLRFCIALVTDFNDKNIDTSTCRKSNDKIKAMKHIELLSDEEFENLRYDHKFEFNGETIEELLQSDEWKTADI